MARAEPSQALELRPGTWTEVEGWIDKLEFDGTSTDWYRREVAAERLHIWSIVYAKDVVLAILWRTETMDWGTELVIVAACGELRGVDLVEEILPNIDSHAKASGCASVRFHTDRNGLGEKAMRLGYYEAEVVYRRSFV